MAKKNGRAKPAENKAVGNGEQEPPRDLAIDAIVRVCGVGRPFAVARVEELEPKQIDVVANGNPRVVRRVLDELADAKRKDGDDNDKLKPFGEPKPESDATS